MSINCCYQCKKRSLKCHSTCEEYINQKAIHDKERESIAIKKKFDYISSKRVK